MDTDAARQAAEDIERGDELLRTNSAPQPSETLLAEIKNNVATAVRRRHSIAIKQRVWATAAVAAVILLVSAIALKMFDRPPVTTRTVASAAVIPAIPAKFWESSDITIDDTDIAMLTAEVETIENELLALRMNEDFGNGNGAVDDLELELIETGGDFWKG